MNECGHCKTAGAKLHCSACLGAPTVDGSLQQTVGYCNKKCQTAHWPTHREQCKTLRWRKELFRAGRLLKKIWNTIRRESFDNYLVAAEESDGTLILHEGNYKTGPTLRPNGFYREFPQSIFKDEKDEDAGLNTLYCYEAVAQMYPVAKWLLHDLCEEICEVTLSVVNPVRNCRYTGPDPAEGTEYNHKVFLVHLKSEEAYAIDLSGAQYGFYEPVVEWNKYMENCRAQSMPFLFGNLYSKLYRYSFRRHLREKIATDMQRAFTVTGELLRRSFERSFIREVTSCYPRGTDLLKLPRSAFEIREEETILLAREITRDATEKLDGLLAMTVFLTRDTAKKICNLQMRGQIASDEIEELVVTLVGMVFGKWERDEDEVLVSVTLRQITEEINRQKRA